MRFTLGLRARHPMVPSTLMPFESDVAFSKQVVELYERSQGRPSIEASSNPYALLPDTLSFLKEWLDNDAPTNIVEFGCGESTSVFARWAASHHARVLSIENDSGWIRNLEKSLSSEQRKVVSFIHAPLRVTLVGSRTFLTYRNLEGMIGAIKGAQLIFLDGPHASGREPVLYSALSYCDINTVIFLDDFNLYYIRDMLASLPSDFASKFVGTAIEANSHGLYAIKCIRAHKISSVPSLGAIQSLRSYWRTYGDFIKYRRSL